jgi:glycosyltransferase involved in cell wall biosynthesis
MAGTATPRESVRRRLLVLATTYPRWKDDHEPAFVHELCRRLTASFDVVAVVPDAPGSEPSGLMDGVHVVRYRYAPRRLQTLVNDGGIAANLRRSMWKWLLVPGFIAGQYLAARRVMKQRRVDVIHAHWLIAPGVVARLLARGRLPYVVTSHGGDLFGFRQPLLSRVKRWVAAGASGLTVVSGAMGDEARRLGLPTRRLVTLPMGVDMSRRFCPDETVARSPHELLFVGRLVPKKGLTHLLNAMPAIAEAYPDVRLRIVGFGPEQAALSRQVQLLGLKSRVTFVGPVEPSALPAIYRSAGVFVAPFIRDVTGDQEGLPVALMEAIATGCPFVVGDVAGLADLLGEASPFQVNPCDTKALVAAVLERLRDPAAALKDVARVRDRAVGHVDWTMVAERYATFIEECIESRKSRA